MAESARAGRQQTIEQNMGLVHACAHRFKGRGIEYEDLFQAGCIGLIKATDAFDYDRGVRFSTYAVPVILGEIRRLFRDGGSIKVSRSLKELSIKVTRARDQLAAREGGEPSVSQLAAYLEIPEEQVVEALNISAPPLSLTADEDSGGGQIDLPVNSPEEWMSELISLRQLLSQLPVSDRRLIILRYLSGKTQSETARQLGMTQVQVSRRERKILEGLRQQLSG